MSLSQETPRDLGTLPKQLLQLRGSQSHRYPVRRTQSALARTGNTVMMSPRRARRDVTATTTVAPSSLSDNWNGLEGDDSYYGSNSRSRSSLTNGEPMTYSNEVQYYHSPSKKSLQSSSSYTKNIHFSSDEDAEVNQSSDGNIEIDLSLYGL